ncbi:MAG: hypothetical protein WCZ02_04015, partial [Lysobacterales bacterium]
MKAADSLTPWQARLLAAVIGIGIGLAGMAGPVAAGDSDSDKVRELEARISQLEAMVAELIGREQAEAGQTARSAEPVQDAQPVQPVQPTLPATTTPGS